jgi:hypothetical protein
VPELPTFLATRYVQPLREGGSLPAVVDTDGGGMFVAKFRGAGQGARALVAELVVGMLAAEAGLPVPGLALIEVAPEFGRSEPDPEIQDLLKASHGVNVGLRYLDGAFNYDGHAAGEMVTPELAAELVWFDALVTNVDRTPRNPNLMVWDGRLWLIDHGAALYAHHDWRGVDEARTRTPFPLIKQHVMLPRADDLRAADARLSAALTPEVIAGVLERVPEALLMDPTRSGEFATADEARARYVEYLTTRLREPRAWVDEAERARDAARAEPPRALKARR